MSESPKTDPGVEFYDSEYFAGLPVESDRIRHILGHLEFGPDEQVCEFGSGLGHILFAIHGRIGFGLGVDFAAYAIEESQQRAAEAGIENLQFACVDVTSLPDDPRNAGRFDKVLLMDVTEHIDDDLMRAFLAAARAILKPGGEVIIHTPNAGYLVEILKDKGIFLKQLAGHIAVRSESHYQRLLSDEGYVVSRAVYLPHYRSPMRQLDQLMMRLPFIGRLFRSRLLLTATART